MTAKEYRGFPLTALWLLANSRDNYRDRLAVSITVAGIAQGKSFPQQRDVIKKALRQRLEMYGAWAI
jgi:hypothetical protein